MSHHPSAPAIGRHWLTRLRPLELAEFLKWVLRIRRQVIEVDGLRVWVDPASNVGSRLLAEGCYEAPLSECVTRLLQPGDTFCDVGANEGWFSILASKSVGPAGRVIAIEPQARLWPVILENTSLNRAANVTLQPFATAAQEGEADIRLYPSVNTGASSLGGAKRRCETMQRVSVLTLARLIEGAGLARIDLMKIDVEGFELEALRGAGDHLGTTIRRIVVEIHDAQLAARGESVDHVKALLTGRGYRTRTVAGVEVWELDSAA